MRTRHLLWVLTASVCVGSAAYPASTNLNHTTSVSRQFTAYAPGPILPSALCVFAERIKHEWLSLLEVTDTWRDPIVLVLRAHGATNTPPVALRIYQIGPVLKYEIDCRVPPPLDKSQLGAAIVGALCLELAHRARPQGTVPENTRIPLWMTEGLSQSIHGRREWLVAVARRAGAAARPWSMAATMQTTSLPADEVERNVFIANAWLLADSLLRRPDGPRKMRQLLVELGQTGNSELAFRRVYGNAFPDETAREKWWSLQQARLTTVVVPQNCSATETARRLDTWLVFEHGLRFESLERHAEQEWLKQALPGRILELEGLLNRAHPLYRPVIQAYRDAARLLAEEKISRYRRTVRAAKKLQGQVDRQVREIAKALDRAEMMFTSGTGSNAFHGYFRTLDRLEGFERQRRNPISDCLDKFDK